MGASGAHHDDGSGLGGRGASVKGDFQLSAGDVLKVAVGQQGAGGPTATNSPPAGGGGLFVYLQKPPENPLIGAGVERE
jgi:hypothetical protein